MNDRGCDCPEHEPGSWTGKHFKECSPESPWKSQFLELVRGSARVLGNGEGHTLLILTDEESRTVRGFLGLTPAGEQALSAYNRGVQRGTDRIKAEFDAEQKRKKADRR